MVAVRRKPLGQRRYDRRPPRAAVDGPAISRQHRCRGITNNERSLNWQISRPATAKWAALGWAAIAATPAAEVQAEILVADGHPSLVGDKRVG